MNEKFFPELSRRLKREDIAIGEAENERLPVLLNGQAAMWITSEGTIFANAKTVKEPECVKLHDQVAGISAQVYEYTAAVAAAPQLVAEGLRENFRLLAEFNGVVLAGREMEGGLGYEFATWRYTADRTGVAHGNYHYDYDTAKLDFACRAGLVQDSRQFSDEQLIEMYRCINETLDNRSYFDQDQRDVLVTVAEQIERSLGDISEYDNLSWESEEAEQSDDSPGLEMTP